MQRRILFAALAASVVLCLSGCGGNSRPISVAITASSSTVDGTDSVTLTATVSNDKNSAGVTWAITSGGGSLSNQTKTSATYTAPAATTSQQSITITATSVAKSTQKGDITVTVPAAPAVTTTSANLTGTVGSAFSVTLQASGGIPPYTWALGTGTTLPACLKLSSNGTLTTASGAPPNASCAGSYPNLTFEATDSGTPTPLSVTSSPLTVTITAPTISFSPTLPGGNVGATYTGSVAATGVIGASAYTIASGSLPSDLSLNSGTGAITGTPKASDAGTFTFTVKVVDAYGDTATSGALSIVITAAPTITFTGTVPTTGTYGVAFAGSAAATGGSGALTYSISAGALPPDLSLSSSTGAITGTPGKAADVGMFNFTVQAADAFGDSATRSYTLTVSYPAMSVTTSALPAGYAGGLYAQTALSATGGTGSASNYSWQLTGGTSLPGGLSLSTAGVISGTLLSTDTTGTVNFTVKVTDTVANISGTANLSIEVKAGVSITTSSLPAGYVGSAYTSTTLQASGGTGTGYQWIVTGGTNLPSGLTLSLAGVLSGTPANPGTTSVTFQVVDSVGNSATATLSITIHAGVSVTAPPLASGYPGSAYTSSAFSASGGSGTGYTWSWAAAAGSTLPNGLSIGSATGVVSGTPVNAGTSSVTSSVVVTATDSVGNKGSATVSITIEATLSITTPATLPAGTVAVAYSQPLAASGGSGTVSSWQLVSGGTSLLAIGLGFNTATGVVSGTTPSEGTASFVVTATDSEGHVSAQVTFGVAINNQLKINQTTLPGVDVGSAYSQTLTASGGSGGGYTFSTDTAGTASLAAVNLSLASSGAITGTPTTTGTASFTAKVTDSANNTATQALTIIVYGALSLPTPSSATPGSGYVGVSYSSSLVGSGGTSAGNLSISVVSGLPADGVSATATGGTLEISGTPTNPPTPPYTISFSVKLADSSTGNSISQSYSILVSAPTAPTLNPAAGSLPAATVNQAYTGTAISATGGVGPNFTWTVNGSQISNNGSQVSIGDGLTVSTNGSSSLSVGGTPTSVTSSGSPVSFTVQVKDNASGLTSVTNTYTIAVNNVQNVNGQISLNNYCSNGSTSPTLPTFTVVLTDSSGNTVQTTSADSNGNYSFTAVANGTYTITPSYSGPSGSSSVFYPASESVTVNNSQITGQNFSVSLGYTVSGTASYSGTTTNGLLYLVLVNNNCSGSGGNGTSLFYPFTSGGNFAIQGVAPGSYTLVALIDPTAPLDLGEGQPNIADPTNGSGNPVTVSTDNVTGVSVALADPGTPSVGSGPVLKAVSPQSSAVVLQFGDVGTSRGQEEYTSYTVQWSTTTSGFSSSNQATFKATGSSGSNVWIIDSAVKGFTGTLADGTAYYFRAMGTNSGGESPWQYWNGSGTSCASTSCAVSATIGAPSEPYTVSGTITIPAGVTINSGAVLYAGLYDEETHSVYADAITNPVTGANSYSVSVPSGEIYEIFGILDQNSDGLIDGGDDTNVYDPVPLLVYVTGDLTGKDATLPGGNTILQWQTQYQSVTTAQGTSTSYGLNLDLREANALPVAITITGGPNIISPVDVGRCLTCGDVEFQDFFNINGDTPNVGDTYTLDITLSNGTVLTGVDAKVSGWNGGSTVVGPSNLATGMSPSATSSSDTPTFSWTNPPADTGGDQYSFGLFNANNTSEIWQIPSSSDPSSFFGSDITSITWDVDPTGFGSTPSVTSLTSGQTYNWFVEVVDGAGNQAQTWIYFVAP